MTKNLSLKLAVLCISLLILSPNAVSVAIADMMQAFPTVAPSTVMLILTLPSLTLIVGTILSSILSKVMRKKTIVLTGLLIFAIGGMGPLFFLDITSILVLRGILGFGLGVITPFTTGLIADFFDGDERNNLMGVQTSVGNTGSILYTVIGGMLAVLGWKNVFWIYAIVIPVLIFFAIRVPEPERPAVTERTERTKLNPKVYLYSLLMFIMVVLFFPLFSQLSTYIMVELQLGTPADIGFVLTASTITGLITGLVFGKIFSKLRNYTVVVSMILFVAGYGLLSFATSLLMLYIGSGIIGVAVTLAMPMLMISTTIVAGRENATLAIGMVSTCGFLAQFSSPIIFGFLTNLFGNTSVSFMYLISAIAFLAGATIFTLLNIFKKAPKENVLVD